MRIKQNHIYIGGGYGANTFKYVNVDEKGHYQPVNRKLYYVRGSFSGTWFNVGLNIGNSMVAGDVSITIR